MKKIILTVIIAVFALNANAQLGIRGGANFSSVKLNVDGSSDSTDSSTGFYLGAFFNLNLGEKLGIRPEFNYISTPVGGEFSDFSLDQIQIPVLLVLNLGKKLKVMAGPSFGFMVDSADSQDSFNLAVDMGGTFDVGKKLFLEARYSLGMTNLLGDTANSDLTVNGLQVGAGFKF